MDYLSDSGRRIYEELERHCKAKLKMLEVDHFELAMLANSFDTYAKAAKVCRDDGYKNKHDQVRPEYTVMTKEYANILKHSAKFGLNPGDRDRIFKGIDKPKKRKPTDGLD